MYRILCFKLQNLDTTSAYACTYKEMEPVYIWAYSKYLKYRAYTYFLLFTYRPQAISIMEPWLVVLTKNYLKEEIAEGPGKILFDRLLHLLPVYYVYGVA